MKHAKKTTKGKKVSNKRLRRKKQLKVLFVLFVIALVGAAITVYRDYKARPGFLEKIWISDRSADYITVAWVRPRNVDKFVVTYNGKTIEVSGRKKNVKLTGLTADTEYRISVRADSKKREGFEALEEKARTKKIQTIEGEAEQIRFANRPVDLEQTAATTLTYAPGSGYSVTDDGKIVFTSTGDITVTAEASETGEYAAASKEIKVEVLDTVAVDVAGASPHVFYKLNKSNCECKLSVEGYKDIAVPQAFIHTDGKYLVSFINRQEKQRLISFGGKKTVYTPKTDLGHANGLAFANGTCYSVRGGTSLKCITFDPANDNYGSFDMAYDASGIAYDEATDTLYTSSRKRLVEYDSDHNVVKEVGRVSRKSKYYVQDCAAYSGILMQGITGENYLGTNYVDFYDMDNSTYLGSLECELGEIESILVDEEGYIELLCNTRSTRDYIWKTPINMKKICAGEN